MVFNVLYHLGPELVDCAYPEGDFSRRELVIIRDKIEIMEKSKLSPTRDLESGEKVVLILVAAVGIAIV